MERRQSIRLLVVVDVAFFPSISSYAARRQTNRFSCAFSYPTKQLVLLLICQLHMEYEVERMDLLLLFLTFSKFIFL